MLKGLNNILAFRLLLFSTLLFFRKLVILFDFFDFYDWNRG